MKRTTAIVLAALTLGLFSCKKEDSTGKDLTILCEVMKPYNYEEGGQLKGITIEVVEGILDQLDLTNTIEISSDWDAIFSRLKTEDNIVAFTTGLTTERKEMFKWVGPVTLWHTGFVALKSSNLQLATIDEAKSFDAIGIVKSYFTGEILRGLGFTNLVEFDNLETLVAGLYQGNVQAVFDNLSLLQIIAQDQDRNISSLDNLLTYATTQGYLAFSRNVSDKIIANWQEQLDGMKDDGTLQELYDTYLPGTPAPGRVTIFTETNPPQSFIGYTGNLEGSSVDMVNAMMDEMGISYPVTMTNWTNAYSQIQLVPNAMTFSTLRSEAREDMFQWVGPVCKKRYCFFVRADTDYSIKTLDDARHLRSVATVTGWSSQEQLVTLGFSNLVTFDTPQLVLQRLLDGDVPCVVLNDIAIRLLLQELNHAAKDVRKEMILSEGQTFLAFSLDTDESYIEQWTAAYNKIVSSGKLKQIWEEWYPDIDW
jgi:ABC-type amino acid transport substrate-binding protein